MGRATPDPQDFGHSPEPSPNRDLTRYHRKRDFKKTAEPRETKKQRSTGRLYVVQKHAARRLHYDLRLELDGVLKSWAVPKGPSLDPEAKRLAVHVEDHPVAYGSFEGTIPKGEYGGGTVMLWDRGEWEPLGDPQADYRKGKLSFRLHGEKLRGKWVLVRIKTKDEDAKEDLWLLRKDADDDARPESVEELAEAESLSVLTGRTMEQIAKGARPARSGTRKPAKASAKASQPAALDVAALTGARRALPPAHLQPELATLVESAPDGDEWLHEVKYDGYRVLCEVRKGKARLLTRNGNDWTLHFPEVATAAAHLPVKNAVLDGEVVALNPEGRPDFQALQNAFKSKRRPPLAYYVFDLPYCEGYDLTSTPLVERKELLHTLVERIPTNGRVLRYSDHVRGHGPVVLQQACRLDLEGVVSKRADSPYESRRSSRWLKIKCGRRQEFVIGGYTDPTGARKGLGSLLLGYYTEDGDLRYAGRVGTGFTETTLGQVHRALLSQRRDTPPFDNPPSARAGRGLHWVEPELVAEVQFLGWTEDGVLRHPSFKGLRQDRAPESVRREVPLASAPTESRSRPRKEEPKSVAGIHLTNPDRILYPEAGLTKLDLARYYEQIAEWMLPHIADRPLTLVRCPEGYDKPCFHQKHLREAWPDAVGGVTVRDDGKESRYVVVNDAKGLVALVQLGVLEIHPWGSRSDNLDRPDRLIFDLDPGPGVAWSAVVEAAWHLRLRLGNLGLESLAKTTGGKGLHVVVPLLRRSAWDEVKGFAKGVAEGFAHAAPDRFTANMSKARREGRIYIDYLRNGREATAIAAYSSRARQGATVATPLDWEELDPKLDPARFTVNTVPARLAKLGRDPWGILSNLRQSLTKAMLRTVTFSR